MVALPMVMRPGAQPMTVSNAPCPAEGEGGGERLEDGSRFEGVGDCRLRNCAPESRSRLLGL